MSVLHRVLGTQAHSPAVYTASRWLTGGATAAAAVALMALVVLGAGQAAAQDVRLGGGVTLPRHGGTEIGGQVQASLELGPRDAGIGLRLDVLYAQSPASAMSVGDLVFAGQSARTMAAVGGIFYRREVRDFAPYLLAGGGAYGQSGMAGVALGAHGGLGVDYSANRYRPFVEARAHRWRGDGGATALQQRERSLISVLMGVRF